MDRKAATIKRAIAQEWKIIEIAKQVQSHYVLDTSVKAKRHDVHRVICFAMGETLNTKMIQNIQQALKRLGVRACVSRGSKYYRGLQIRDENDLRCCACRCHSS